MRHRGVSQIIGVMFMLAIVASIAGLMGFRILNGISDFQDFVDLQGEKSPESFEIVHVRLDPTDQIMEIFIRNTGEVEILIDRITLVQDERQILILNNSTEAGAVVETIQINPESIARIVYGPDSLVLTPSSGSESDATFGDSDFAGKQMELSVVTSRGTAKVLVMKPIFDRTGVNATGIATYNFP